MVRNMSYLKKTGVNIGLVPDIHPEQFLPPLHPALPKVRIILNLLYALCTLGSIGVHLYCVGICTVFYVKGLKCLVISATLNWSGK